MENLTMEQQQHHAAIFNKVDQLLCADVYWNQTAENIKQTLFRCQANPELTENDRVNISRIWDFLTDVV